MKKYKGPYDIYIDDKKYIAEVEFFDEDGDTYVIGESLQKAQINLAIDLIIKNKNFNSGLFNYLMNVLAERASWVAPRIEASTSQISLARKGERDLSKPSWKLFRLLCLSKFESKENKKKPSRRSDQILLEEVS